jgi:hypothetical protein
LLYVCIEKLIEVLFNKIQIQIEFYYSK